jgi:hypothetical protein
MLLAALAVAAALGAVPLRGAGAEPFLDGYSGTNFTRDADLTIEQPAVGNDFTIRDLSFDPVHGDGAPYYGVRAGYFFGEAPSWFGLALEFFHFKMSAETDGTRDVSGTIGGTSIAARLPVAGVVQHFSLTNGLSYVTLDALVRHGFLVDDEDFPHGRLQLYAGVGVGPVIGYPRSRIQGVDSEPGYQLAGVGGQGFAGVRFLLFRNVGLFAEGKVTYSRLTVDVARGGTAELTEQSLHLVGGITLMFP